MHFKRLSIVLTILVLSAALVGCQQKASNPAENVPAVEAPAVESEPTDEPAPEPASEEINLVPFMTDDGIFNILMPEGWATNQAPLSNGISFGIAPTAEGFSAGPALFDQSVIMVYGSVEQISPDLAARENVGNFHNFNFYGETSVFNYVMGGEPVVMEPSPYVIYYLTQATAQLSTGVITHWLLGTALADQTVVLFAIGVPDGAMEQYGAIAQEMFNSVQIDTAITGELVQ